MLDLEPVTRILTGSGIEVAHLPVRDVYVFRTGDFNHPLHSLPYHSLRLPGETTTPGKLERKAYEVLRACRAVASRRSRYSYPYPDYWEALR